MIKSIFRILGIWGILGWCVTAEGKAQNLITRQGTATVPILNENLVEAETKAVLLAKQTILKELLLQFIAPKILTQAQRLIQDKLLAHPDRFIESIQMLQSQDFAELSKFKVVLEARIFQASLRAQIKRLNLALLGDPIRRAVLLYDPRDVLWEKPQKKNSLLILNRLLDPYKIHLQQTIPLDSQWLTLFSKNPRQPLPKKILAQSKVPTYLLIDLDLKKKATQARHTPAVAVLKLGLYEAAQGKSLQDLQLSQSFEIWEPKQSIPLLLEQMAFEWDSVIAALVSADQKKGNLLQVKLIGLETPEQERVLVQALFQKQPLWRQFRLSVLSENYVVYQGYYSGSPKALLAKIKKIQHPFYRITEAVWQENVLEFQIQWREQPTLLLAYQPVDVVEHWIETQALLVPKKQVPSERTKSLYQLPASLAVYDYLRSRGDSTLYKVEWPQPGEVIQGIWSRIARTHLTPVLSIYDAQRNLIERYPPKVNGIIQFEYQLPKTESHFYIRIHDQIGYIQGEAGSFLSLHYAIQVSPQKNNSTQKKIGKE